LAWGYGPHPADYDGQAATVFSDDFEEEFTGWSLTGTPHRYTGSPKDGTHSIRLRKAEAIERTISTAGQSGIAAAFSMGAQSLEDGDTVRALWHDGSSWNALAVIAEGDPEAEEPRFADKPVGH